MTFEEAERDAELAGLVGEGGTGGLVVVVIIIIFFGLLTGAKLAARSAGLLPSVTASTAPPAAQVPSALVPARPDTVVVSLDAGRRAP